MAEKSNPSPTPKVPDLGMWKTVGRAVQFNLWQAHGSFTEAILHLEARDGKYAKQVEKLKKIRNEVKTIIEEISTFEET